jgi:hypothetical protein
MRPAISKIKLDASEQGQRLFRILFIKTLNGEAGMNDDVFSGLDVFQQLQADLAFQSAELDRSKVALDFHDPHGYGKAHGFSVIE